MKSAEKTSDGAWNPGLATLGRKPQGRHVAAGPEAWQVRAFVPQSSSVFAVSSRPNMLIVQARLLTSRVNSDSGNSCLFSTRRSNWFRFEAESAGKDGECEESRRARLLSLWLCMSRAVTRGCGGDGGRNGWPFQRVPASPEHRASQTPRIEKRRDSIKADNAAALCHPDIS